MGSGCVRWNCGLRLNFVGLEFAWMYIIEVYWDAKCDSEISWVCSFDLAYSILTYSIHYWNEDYFFFPFSKGKNCSSFSRLMCFS